MNPASKSATVRQNQDYYEPILGEGFNPDNVYDTLDFIAARKGVKSSVVSIQICLKKPAAPRRSSIGVTPNEKSLRESDNR